MWTHFWDMHSGGGQKLDWPHIFIEASEGEAKIVFYNRFGRNPEKVTCTCCGEDYSISEYESLAKATQYQRKDSFGRRGKPLTVKEYLKTGEAHVIYIADIKDTEQEGNIPQQDYVWAD